MKNKYIITLSTIITIVISVIFYLINSPGLLFELARSYERGSLVEKSTNIKDHKIVYLESGIDKEETILFVHGFGGDKDNWTRLAVKFSDKYHIISIDLPGFGDSSKHENLNYNVTNQVKRLNEFNKKINLNKFHLVGNSMGGMISGLYASTYPEQIITLGFFDTAGIKVESHFTKSLKKGKNPLLVESVQDYDRLVKYIFYKPPYIPGVIKKYFAEKAFESRDFNNKVMKDLTDQSFSLAPYLEKIKIPVFIIWGDTDRVIDISSVKVLEKHLPNSTTIIMEKCGHLPMLERPAEAAKHYLKFLENH